MKTALVIGLITLSAFRCHKQCWVCFAVDSNSSVAPPSCHASPEEIKQFEIDHHCKCGIPDRCLTV